VTARPQVNGDIAAAGKINTRNNIAGRPAARHGARTNVVEACVEKFLIVFECGVFRKQKASFQAILKAGPFCGAVLRSAGRKLGRRQTAQNEVSSFHGHRPSWTVPIHTALRVSLEGRRPNVSFWREADRKEKGAECPAPFSDRWVCR
jgi:hypothetical protein